MLTFSHGGQTAIDRHCRYFCVRASDDGCRRCRQDMPPAAQDAMVMPKHDSSHSGRRRRPAGLMALLASALALCTAVKRIAFAARWNAPPVAPRPRSVGAEQMSDAPEQRRRRRHGARPFALASDEALPTYRRSARRLLGIRRCGAIGGRRR